MTVIARESPIPLHAFVSQSMNILIHSISNQQCRSDSIAHVSWKKYTHDIVFFFSYASEKTAFTDNIVDTIFPSLPISLFLLLLLQRQHTHTHIRFSMKIYFPCNCWKIFQWVLQLPFLFLSSFDSLCTSFLLFDCFVCEAVGTNFVFSCVFAHFYKSWCKLFKRFSWQLFFVTRWLKRSLFKENERGDFSFVFWKYVWPFKLSFELIKEEM